MSVCVVVYMFMFLFLAARSIVLFMLIRNSLAKGGDKSLHFIAQLKLIFNLASQQSEYE